MEPPKAFLEVLFIIVAIVGLIKGILFGDRD